MTVYITQNMDGRNFIPAQKFGELRALLPEKSQILFDAAPILKKLRDGMDDFNDNDFLLLSGDPIIIGLAMMVADEVNHGKMTLLKWDKQEKTYYPVQVDMYAEEKAE